MSAPDAEFGSNLFVPHGSKAEEKFPWKPRVPADVARA